MRALANPLYVRTIFTIRYTGGSHSRLVADSQNRPLLPAHGGMLGLRDTTIASPQDQSASMRHHGSGGACIVSVDGGFGVIQVSGSLQQGIQQSEHLRGKGWAYPCQVSSVTSSATRPAWSALLGEGRLGGAQVLVASGCQASCRHDTAALDLWQ